MSKPLNMLAIVALAATLMALGHCKKAAVVGEDDVLGAWEIKSWLLKGSDMRFQGCDMLGTLTFTRESWGGVRVYLTFTRDGLERTLWGDVDLSELPVIIFECHSSEGFSSNMAFRGIVEDGGMFGYAGFFWDMKQYGDWEWEAVKK